MTNESTTTAERTASWVIPKKAIFLALGVLLAIFLVFGSLVLLPALMMTSDTGATLAAGEPSDFAKATIPADLIPLYQRAGQAFGIPWTVLAAIHDVETHFNRGPAPDSPVGAQGPMQFMPATFRAYAVDGDGDGVTNIQDVADAVFTAAHLLAANGFAEDPRQAIYLYNHADWYVDEVLGLAAKFATVSDVTAHADASPLGANHFNLLVARGMSILGQGYVFGGEDPATGMDCSAFTRWCYSAIGVSLPRTAQQQWDAVQHIPASEARPGDLVFFAHTYPSSDTVTHVAIYLGNGKMLSDDDAGVGIHDIWPSSLYGFGRVQTLP